MEAIHPGIKTVNVHPAERWLCALSGGALIFSSLRRKSVARPLKLVSGVEMLRRSATGHCYVYQAFGMRTAPTGNGFGKPLPYELGVRGHAAVTVRKPRQEVFSFWRNLENLPRFMKHVKSVSIGEGGRSHWIAEGPGGRTLEWDAEIHNEIPGELIAWRSLPNSEVDSAGSVKFKDAPAGEGTEVRVELQYNPPAGIVGAYVAKFFGREPEEEIQDGLDRLKQHLETGEIATVEGQPKGDPAAVRAPNSRARRIQIHDESTLSEVSR